MENLFVIKKACFTGYRPKKFDFKLNKSSAEFDALLSHLISSLTALINEGCSVFYCGMAPGFDIIAAECVLSLKKKYNGIRLVCAVPYLGHEYSIGEEWIKRYNNVLNCSDEIVYVSTEYNISCFQARNRYMVDNSDCVICWYDGKTGGTRNTLRYAQKTDRYILNLNTKYEDKLNNCQQKLPLI